MVITTDEEKGLVLETVHHFEIIEYKFRLIYRTFGKGHIRHYNSAERWSTQRQSNYG